MSPDEMVPCHTNRLGNDTVLIEYNWIMTQLITLHTGYLVVNTTRMDQCERTIALSSSFSAYRCSGIQVKQILAGAMCLRPGYRPANFNVALSNRGRGGGSCCFSSCCTEAK
eukprot:m.253304 g.253304  ORF g.253304 m.253304 type:complete len:112 (-) comp15483_c1_seq1:445-780(-)